MWARPQDPLTVGRLVVNGIINNDMWIFPAPEYLVGVQARGMAMAESMVPFTPMPEHIAAGRDRYYRTPIYVQEIPHRRATRRRNIPGSEDEHAIPTASIIASARQVRRNWTTRK